ncbi:MAG: hypothetical protein H7Z11_17225 [Verrucomicrobia bacterium]|nr:hypothetical protein [Leptolyngbya sp. ES-bin-22]
MARRRLSDLLREEANKPSEDATAAGAEPSTDEPDAENLDTAEESVTIASSAPPKASTAAKHTAAKRTAATPQEPSAQQQDETVLQQIADLTSALDTQKVTVETLQTELEQMHGLKTELEQTRKDMRQLTDANAKLTQELKTLQTKKPALDSSASPETAKAYKPQELKLAPAPVEPGQTAHVEASGHPLNSFNRDVGWFD